MRTLATLILALAVMICLQGQSQAVYFAQSPTLTPDASYIIFSYDSDLWKVDAKGGMAQRITAMDGIESRPSVSPDGKWLAFSSNQYGNNDIYIMSMDGGQLTQLTYHQSNDQMESWSWDSQTIYFTSNRYNRMSTYTIAAKGGTPQRLFSNYFNNIHNARVHPKSGDIYFNESWESSLFWHRKRYKGPYNPDIKSYNLTSKKLQQHTDYDGKDMWATIDRSGTVYFVSDRSNEEYNLYRLTEGKPKKLTSHKTAVSFPNVSADGSAIVYLKDYQIHLLNTKSGRSKPVDIRLNAYKTLTKSKDYNTSGKVSAFDISRDGKKIALVSRGELFVSDMKGKFVKQLQTGASGRVLEVHWLKDDKTLLFNQTVGGFQNWFTIQADGSGGLKQHTNDQANNRDLSISKDTSQAIYLSGRNEIRLMNLDDFTSKVIARDELWGLYNDVPQWSPDDRYVMYTAYRNFERDIFLIDMENDYAITNLTQTGVEEVNPFWSPDGKYIYFSSDRHHPNYPSGGSGDANLYQLPLQKYDRPYRSDEFAKLFTEEDKKKDSVYVQLDLDKLMERVRTVGPRFGNQRGAYVIQKGDKTTILYPSNHDEGRYHLWKTVMSPYEDTKTTKIAGPSVGTVSDIVFAKGNYYFEAAGNIHKIDLAKNKLEKIEVKHGFTRNLQAEFEQMFYETWANLDENFYSEDMHGTDWPALRDRYAKYLPYITNRADLRRLTNDLLGELNTSHFGFNSNGSEERKKLTTSTSDCGILFDNQAPYTVAAIVSDGPADRYEKDIQAGDRLIAVNGEKVDPNRNREFYFSGPSRARELVLSFARGDKTHDVKLHPGAYQSTVRQLYDEWIDNNQARVDQQAKGRIAYVHMKNMTGGSLDGFLNEMVSEWYQRDALILDLRYNTGGNVHDAVLQFLSQKPYLNWKYRGGELSPQPNFSPAEKPVVLLINEQSLSDAEMTTEGFKQLGLGTVVGTPTYRWIIFTSGKGLVDGSFYRLPSWGCFSLDGKNLEKTGVEPDIYVKNTMKDRLEGKDPQLDRAIQLILSEMK